MIGTHHQYNVAQRMDPCDNICKDDRVAIPHCMDVTSDNEAQRDIDQRRPLPDWRVAQRHMDRADVPRRARRVVQPLRERTVSIYIDY
eukprot:COSAG01_NODE_47486_length_389_cov_4.762069_1_plen_88_part_00